MGCVSRLSFLQWPPATRRPPVWPMRPVSKESASVFLATCTISNHPHPAFGSLNRRLLPRVRFPHAVIVSALGGPGQPCDLRPGPIPCRARSVCLNNLCLCPSNLVLYQGICIDFIGEGRLETLENLLVGPGQSCAAPGTICSGGASCIQGLCICAAGYYPSGSICVPVGPPTPPIIIPTQGPIFICEFRFR